jgi:hypothetical protein
MPPKQANPPLIVGPGGTYATHAAYRTAYFANVDRVLYGGLSAQPDLNAGNALMRQHDAQ